MKNTTIAWGSLLPASALLLSLLLAGCIVHHRRPGPRPVAVQHQHHSPPPARPAQPVAVEHHSGAVEQPPAPGRTHRAPPAPGRTHDAPPAPGRTHRAPPAPRQPELMVNLSPTQARRGQQVTLHLRPFRTPVTVWFNGRPLPKKTVGNNLKVTVPGNASSGYFEVEWDGRRYRSPHLTVIP